MNSLIVSRTILSSSSEYLSSVVEGGGAAAVRMEFNTSAGPAPCSMGRSQLSIIVGEMDLLSRRDNGVFGVRFDCWLQNESRAASALATGDVGKGEVGVEYPDEVGDGEVGTPNPSVSRAEEACLGSCGANLT